jgi:hypothetical protein
MGRILDIIMPAICLIAAMAAATYLLSTCSAQRHLETMACTQQGGVFMGSLCVWSQEPGAN